MKPPKVSVLIPTYNYARFLPEAIGSVLAQQFGDFELLIVDDCSTDDTAEVVRLFVAQDSRIQFIIQPRNAGMVNNWNYCLQQARGEYIKFLFGDDRLCGTLALGKLVTLLDTHPTATLAASARVIFDEQGRVLDLYRDLPDGLHDGRKVIASILMANGKNLVGEPSAVLFRRKEAARGFNPRYRQVVDVEMWFHLMENSNLVYTGEPLCGFRSHALQETERNTATGLAAEEHARFFSEYATRPWLPRRIVLPLLYHMRRLSRENAVAHACAQRLIQRWGAGWFAAYACYWLGHRLAKPFHNIAHSIQKRRFRRRYPLMTNADVSF